MKSAATFAIVLIALLSRPTLADDRVDKAVEKAAIYIKNRQDAADGLFKDKWFHAYPAGETALSLLALLKAGVEPDDPAINRGFAALQRAPFKKIYSVSIAILALEARYTPPPDPAVKGGMQTQLRNRFKKASPADKAWLAKAAQYLVTNQRPNGLWNYPFGGDDDLSNAQFALLALKAAQRMGFKVPETLWLKTLEYLIAKQERDGETVAPFPVPAANGSISAINEGKESTTQERGDYKARGWGYKPDQGARASMTAAGVACMVICKSELEVKKGFDKKYGEPVDRSIRDGAAWLGQRFKSDVHPGAELDWLFYYLYTLERAGTLSGCQRFGSHDWYEEGKESILKLQRGDGAFERSTTGESDGILAGTCLGLLFLKRSTIPVIERETTGDVRREPAGGAAAAGSNPSIERQDDGRFKVTFRFRARPGANVSIAGSFNAWNKDANRMSDPDNDGTFDITMTLEAGEHTYKFVIDGSDWRMDPENSNQKPDGLGGANSLLKLE